MTKGRENVEPKASSGHPAQLMGPLFSLEVLAILFALTFTKALQVVFQAVPHYPTVAAAAERFWVFPHTYICRLFLLGAFLVTLFRFYLGSYRFHKERPEGWERLGQLRRDLGVVCDWAGTALLFTGFYIAATLLPTGMMFLAVVALFHVADASWLLLCRWTMLAPRYVRHLTKYYWWYDAVTVAIAALIYLASRAHRLSEPRVQVLAALLLIAMFCIDVLWQCRDWYFDPDAWRQRHSKPWPQPTGSVYFAGPLFTQAERQWNADLAAEIEKRSGLTVLLPQKTAAAICAGKSELGDAERRALFDAAIRGVKEADVVLAALDGPDPDSGTCFECGYAHAIGKPILGVRTDLRQGGDGDSAVNLMLSGACRAIVAATAIQMDPAATAVQVIDAFGRAGPPGTAVGG